jgi:hypothetical protein
MNLPATRLRLAAEDRNRAIISLVTAEAISLSALHHLVNLWGLPATKILLAVLVVGPAVATVIFLGLGPVWKDFRAVRAARWATFLIPAALIAAALTWRYFAEPEVGHLLEIDPSVGAAGSEVRIMEIRAEYGNTVPLSKFLRLVGWGLEDGILKARDPSAATIQYAFTGPTNEQVRVRFVTSPQGGTAAVTLDGKRIVYDLSGPTGNVTHARLDTQFRWGALNFLIAPILILADWLAAASVLGMIWAAHEIGQDRRSAGAVEVATGLRSHAKSLLIIISMALAIHILSFLSVPLVMTKDSPSYLDGAVHWLTNHNLDGVPPYRGPGTTLLFVPAMAIFGRSPWGVKLGLHLLALACVPLAYWLGWQLGQRRWLAVVAGLIPALTPDLYSYSSIVMTEVLQAFALLVFGILIVSALQTLSPRWILVSALAGSLAVLVRAENIVILCIYLAVLVVVLLRRRDPLTAQEKGGRSLRTVRGAPMLILVGALITAAAPLLAWSAHNARVHGFFGISNAGPGALYDGWMYFGENSGIKIVDPQSDAVRAISASIPITAGPDQLAPTVWTVHSALVRDGYTVNEALAVLGRATIESIRAKPVLAWRLLGVKLREGFQPYAVLPDPIPGANRPNQPDRPGAAYFDPEPASPAALIILRQLTYGLIADRYSTVYTVWLWVSAAMLWLSSYRRPWVISGTLAAIAATSMLLPNIIGMSMWRYSIPGLAVVQSIALVSLANLGRFALHYAREARLAIQRIR